MGTAKTYRSACENLSMISSTSCQARFSRPSRSPPCMTVYLARADSAPKGGISSLKRSSVSISRSVSISPNLSRKPFATLIEYDSFSNGEAWIYNAFISFSLRLSKAWNFSIRIIPRLGSSDFLNLGCEDEVVLGETIYLVGPDRNLDLSVGQIYIRMMALLFGYRTNGIGERQSLLEITELK